MNLSLLTITLIAIERYMAICQPLKHHLSSSTSLKLIAALWLVAFGWALPTFFIADVTAMSTCFMKAFGTGAVTYHMVNAILIIILFFAIAVLYCLMLRSIAAKDDRLSESNQNTSRASKRQSVKVVICITVLFYATNLPMLIHYLVIMLPNEIWVKERDDNMRAASLILFYLNSSMNPVIYNIFSIKFRQACISVLRRKSLKKQGQRK